MVASGARAGVQFTAISHVTVSRIPPPKTTPTNLLMLRSRLSMLRRGRVERRLRSMSRRLRSMSRLGGVLGRGHEVGAAGQAFSLRKVLVPQYTARPVRTTAHTDPHSTLDEARSPANEDRTPSTTCLIGM